MPTGFREKAARYRAVVKNRRALRKRGMSRFEVRGLDRDKALLRDIARRLAAGDEAAQRLRAELLKETTPGDEERGGIWRWLRSSPLVGSDINLEREAAALRKIDL